MDAYGLNVSLWDGVHPQLNVLNIPESGVTGGERGRGGGVLWVEADRYTKACQNSYLNPHPVPPRTIAARRIAPAMDPIMILVPLGPAQRKEEGREGAEEEEEGQKQNNTTKKTHVRGQHRHRTSTTSTGERW